MSYTVLKAHENDHETFVVSRHDRTGEIVLEVLANDHKSYAMIYLDPDDETASGKAYDFFMLGVPAGLDGERDARLALYDVAQFALSSPKDKWVTPLMPAEGVVADDETAATDITEEKKDG